jgi:hypothetical protein
MPNVQLPFPYFALEINFKAKLQGLFIIKDKKPGQHPCWDCPLQQRITFFKKSMMQIIASRQCH